MDEREMYDMVCKPQIAGLERKVDKVIALLEGNGKVGIIDLVRENTDARQEAKDKRQWFYRIVIGTIVVQFLTLMFFLIRLFIT